MSDTKLKPCPFCGGTNLLVEVGFVCCDDCGCEVHEIKENEDVVAKWNTRKPMERIEEKIEQQKKIFFLTIANTGDEKMDYAYTRVAGALERAIEIVKEEGGL